MCLTGRRVRNTEKEKRKRIARMRNETNLVVAPVDPMAQSLQILLGPVAAKKKKYSQR